LAQRAVKDSKVRAHQKLIGRILAKEYLKYVKPNSFRGLRDEGAFRKKQEAAMYINCVPWMMATTAEILRDDSQVDDLLGLIVDEAYDEMTVEHKKTLETERERQRRITEERRLKEEEEARRKEALRKEREERRRAAELQRLHDKIDQLVIKKGEMKDVVLKQELTAAHGCYLGKDIVGVLTGVLGEMAIVLSATAQSVADKPFVTDKSIYVFTIMYLTQCMKNESFYVFFGPAIVQLLASKNVKLEDTHTLDPDALAQFTQLYDSAQHDDPLLPLLKDSCKDTGIMPEALDWLRLSLRKLILRKPTDNDPGGNDSGRKIRREEHGGQAEA
jgi:hypothetical protein